MSVNKVILVGNVGSDPQISYIDSRAMATFSLATNEPGVVMPDGRRGPERTEWHRIVLWGPAAETAERYITRGTKLYVEGKLRTRVWEDRNTIKHQVTEIYADTFDILSRPRPAAPGQPQ